MKDVILRQIRAEYDRKKLRAMSKAEKRKQKLYDAFPRIEEIDKEIASNGIKLTKLVITKPDNYMELMNNIKADIEALKGEKSMIFRKNNIPADYLEIVYECPYCKDTGFLENGQKCKCYTQQIIEKLNNMSNIKHVLTKENFNTFNINVFSNEPYEQEPLTPRQNMYAVLSTCDDFCQKFDRQATNLLFYGGTGLGKTFMCNCIAYDLIQKGKTVLYQTAFNILEVVENHKFNRQDETDTNRENYKFLFDCDLLIIDDLGTEFNNSFTNAELFNIINSRIIANKRIVISTNLSLEQLATTYSDRIISRIFNQFTTCKFYGRDLRWEI